MKVEIWSDVMCPFCYIGKRRFEAALADFDGRDQVEIEWKSFQLNPDLKTDPSISIHDYLAQIKGWDASYARDMNNQVTAMAAEVGLQYDMDRAVVANSFDAHRFAHLAKKHGKGPEAEEALFKAYFTQGKNIADHNTLADLGASIGLDAEEVRNTLNTDTYAQDVHQDIYEAQQIGVRGVPFFVLDNKYAVSGAQSSLVFLSALEKALGEWKQGPEIINEGDSCDIDGNC
jgi:predicted DsbA family dithiol-disulfide isomerase